mmetsp:Transcript_47831/g.133092  ORF Transcript_47831/g.133092 Transcript_47831/m.133092 type:complete len:124 (+) Transcript_47831:94-465(+)
MSTAQTVIAWPIIGEDESKMHPCSGPDDTGSLRSRRDQMSRRLASFGEAAAVGIMTILQRAAAFTGHSARAMVCIAAVGVLVGELPMSLVVRSVGEAMTTNGHTAEATNSNVTRVGTSVDRKT